MTLHVICSPLQNIILNTGNLKLDVVFQSLYGEGFTPVHSLLQANLLMSSLEIEGATEYDMLFP
jgi:hypothetical protein